MYIYIYAYIHMSLQVLVATDVAARGLDVKGLSAVVNYDLPRATADYTHRVGRTGRAGNTGVAVSFITADNAAHFALIERRLGGGRGAVPREVVGGFEPTRAGSSSNVSTSDDAAAAQYRARMDADASGAGAGGAGGGAALQGAVAGVRHSHLGLAHDRMHGGVKGRRKSKKDKLREAAAAAAAVAASGQGAGGGGASGVGLGAAGGGERNGRKPPPDAAQ